MEVAYDIGLTKTNDNGLQKLFCIQKRVWDSGDTNKLEYLETLVTHVKLYTAILKCKGQSKCDPEL